MISLETYKKSLSSRGNNIAEITRHQSDMIINTTFTHDPAYKKVYILTKDGWLWEDAKYQFHSAQSLAKDSVDYYLQFRPNVHYPIGSYVIIPDDTSSKINLTTEELVNPFLQPAINRTQWWVIVGRDNANAYVRYMVLKCDWEFKWLDRGILMNCWGCLRSANSYTSGVWRDEYTASLDDLRTAWIPDTYHVYGDQLNKLGLYDTRTIDHGQRFFMSNNTFNPRIYQVTKINDITPQGIIKMSIKQDEINLTQDNFDLQVCNYYTSTGECLVEDNNPVYPDVSVPYNIYQLAINQEGELDYVGIIEKSELHLGQSDYFGIKSDAIKNDLEWQIRLKDDAVSIQDKEYYEKMIKLNRFDENTISIKPSKAYSLIGKVFILSAYNSSHDMYSSIELEVFE